MKKQANRVPVVEQDAVTPVKIELDQIVAAPSKATAAAPVGAALAEVQTEHRRRAIYLDEIQQYVSGRRTQAPARLEPNDPASVPSEA